MAVKINENYLKLKSSYLFVEVARREAEFIKANPDANIIKMGIGDVTKPLAYTMPSSTQETATEAARPSPSISLTTREFTQKRELVASSSTTA